MRCRHETRSGNIPGVYFGHNSVQRCTGIFGDRNEATENWIHEENREDGETPAPPAGADISRRFRSPQQVQKDTEG